MAVTWEDLRGQLVDLGFEEDTITTEYARLMRNSVNRALDVLYYTVVPQIEDYYKFTQSWGYEDDSGKWVLPKPKHITADTEDSAPIVMAGNLQPLVPLLAAHYIWLDDDMQKAVLYWNQYDTLKDQIVSVCRRPRGAQIVGGVGF